MYCIEIDALIPSFYAETHDTVQKHKVLISIAHTRSQKAHNAEMR